MPVADEYTVGQRRESIFDAHPLGVRTGPDFPEIFQRLPVGQIERTSDEHLPDRDVRADCPLTGLRVERVVFHHPVAVGGESGYERICRGFERLEMGQIDYAVEALSLGDVASQDSAGHA